MFKIRRSMFETNSSSNDVYDDFDDDGVSDGFDAEITLSMTFQTVDNIQKILTEDKQDDFITIFVEIFNEYTKNLKECIFYDMDVNYTKLEITDDNTLVISLADDFYFETTHYWDGEYCPATKYSPAEYPDLFFELDDDPPVWKDDEWNEGLEQALLKSTCGNYLTKLLEVNLDDSDFDYQFEKLDKQYYS